MFANTITHGLVMSFFASVLLLGSINYNPRLWLQDYPNDVQEKVLPKTKKEKLQSTVVGSIFIILIFIGPIISNWILLQTQGSLTFFEAFFNTFGIAMVFNVVDWLILDWLILCTFTPRFMVIPGTEGMKGYKNYIMHFKGFVIGTGFSLIASTVIAIIFLFVT